MKRWLKQRLPGRQRILASRAVNLFGTLLHAPNLWHLNRHSVSGGAAVGLFAMFLPLPGQTLAVVALAIFFRVNLPVAVAASWVSNPLTMPAMFYAAYGLGCLLLGWTPEGFRLEFWADWRNWLGILPPLLLGSLICGLVCAASGYFTIQMLWRLGLRRAMAGRRERRARYQLLANSALSNPSSRRQE